MAPKISAEDQGLTGKSLEVMEKVHGIQVQRYSLEVWWSEDGILRYGPQGSVCLLLCLILIFRTTP